MLSVKNVSMETISKRAKFYFLISTCYFNRILLEGQLLIPAYVSLTTGERAFIERYEHYWCYFIREDVLGFLAL